MPKTTRKKGSKINPARLSFIILGTFLLLIAASVFLQLHKHFLPCGNSISCVNNLSGKKESVNKGIFMGRLVTAPNLTDSHTMLAGLQDVLGDTTADDKHIFVDLTNQKLFAYEGNNRVFEFLISSGKWYPTPTGNFRIHVWLRYTRMTGGSGGTYYDLPNVPYTMYFGNSDIPWYRGFSLHGAYWHNNFGHPMSHGCVNLRTEDAQKLYEWTDPNTASSATYETKDNPGTQITIYGAAPSE